MMNDRPDLLRVASPSTCNTQQTAVLTQQHCATPTQQQGLKALAQQALKRNSPRNSSATPMQKGAQQPPCAGTDFVACVALHGGCNNATTPIDTQAFRIPDDCCPGCVTVWRTGSGRWIFTGPDDDLRQGDPDAVRVMRAAGGCIHGG